MDRSQKQRHKQRRACQCVSPKPGNKSQNSTRKLKSTKLQRKSFRGLNLQLPRLAQSAHAQRSSSYVVYSASPTKPRTALVGHRGLQRLRAPQRQPDSTSAVSPRSRLGLAEALRRKLSPKSQQKKQSKRTKAKKKKKLPGETSRQRGPISVAVDPRSPSATAENGPDTNCLDEAPPDEADFLKALELEIARVCM